jgi:importin subunit alpha-6/7
MDVKKIVILHPILRIVGAISNGEEYICQGLIDHGVVDKLETLLNNESKNVRKEILWILSNIAAGNTEQI